MSLDAYVADLFSPAPAMRVHTPAARRSDPESSHVAAEHITASGARGAQQNQATEAVRQFPGHTSAELAQLSGIDRYALARRLPECATAKRVRKGDARDCNATGRLAMTWWPV